MSDLVTWISDTATIIINQVPLQSRTTAIVLIEAWLSDIGGWAPDDQLQPNGEGEPINGFTEQQAADEITANQYNSVYDLNFDAIITLNVQISGKFSENLDINQARDALKNQLTDFLTDRINESNLPIRVDVINDEDLDANEDRSVLGGYTTQAIRLGIAADLEADDKVIDYKATALRYVRETYGLDNDWNVVSVYTQPNSPISIIIQKYDDDSYVDLDEASSQIYVLSISPETYAIVSGVIIG